MNKQVEQLESQSAPISPIGKALIITLSVGTLLATIICWCRIILRKRKAFLGLDDWLLILALVLLYAQDALAFVAAAKGGVGTPMKELMETSINSLELLFVVLYICEILYCVLIYTLKASILISYFRLFGKTGWVAWAIKTMFGLSTMWFIASFFGFLFQCRPIEAGWKPLEVHGNCIDFVAFIWGTSVTNVILDWTILALPILPVLKLQMSFVQKGLIIGSFLLGSIACVASTTRAALTSRLNDGDIPKSGALIMIFTVIEPVSGIISACLPFLARIFGRYLHGTWSNIVKFTGGLSGKSAGGAERDQYVVGVGAKSPVRYELHNLHYAGKREDGPDSVRNLIP